MIIDGKRIAKKIEEECKGKILRLKEKHPHATPKMAFFCIGNHAPSLSYVKKKKQKCQEVGILSEDLFFPETISELELLTAIKKANEDPHIHGILVQLPLPDHISPYKVMENIDPDKDVDGFHPVNMGRLLLGEEKGLLPCTPLGIITLLEDCGIFLAGKHVVILGRSNIVGKPLAALLMQKKPYGNATVTLAHSYTENLIEICKSADVLVAAMGKPHFVQPSMIKKGAIVIDVGINKITENGTTKIVGDVDFSKVSPLCSYISPVPGGVGPMTIAMLLANTVKSFERHLFKKH